MRLPTILMSPLFSEAELSALRLDGDVLPLGDGAIPIDVPETAGLRAATIRFEDDRRRLVAELDTAAWVHGAAATLIRPLRWCMDLAGVERTRTRSGLREVQFVPADVVELAGLRLTSPLRTAMDLARMPDVFTRRDAVVVAALLAIDGVTPAEAADELRSRPPTPNKRRGVTRLVRLAA